MATCKVAHALIPVCFQVSVFLCNNRSTEQVTQPHAEVNICHQHLETVYLPFLKLCSECVVQLCVLFIYLFVFMLTRKGEKREKCMVQKTKFITSPTWWRAGSIERGAGAGGITGATGLSLVEGPFQLPPPLDPAVLLTEVLEDLLCGGQTGNKKNRIKKKKNYTYSHMLPTLRHLVVEMMVSVNYLEVFDANFKCPHLNSRISQLLFFAHRFVPGKNPAYFH